MHFEPYFAYTAMLNKEKECDSKLIFFPKDDMKIYNNFFELVNWHGVGEPMIEKNYIHMKYLVKEMLNNMANSLVETKDKRSAAFKGRLDPQDYMITAAEYLFASAMAKGNCNEMPYLFGEDVHQTIRDCAFKIHQAYAKDVSTDRTFKEQRKKDADEMRENYMDKLLNRVNSDEANLQEIGTLVSEYQALIKRQENHGRVWRFFHGKENQARETLINDMSKAIAARLGEDFPAKSIDPNEVLKMRDVFDTKTDKIIDDAYCDLPKEYGYELIGQDISSKVRESTEDRQKLNEKENTQLFNDTKDKQNEKETTAPVKEKNDTPSLNK